LSCKKLIFITFKSPAHLVQWAGDPCSHLGNAMGVEDAHLRGIVLAV
jgi:hypothetical protein